MTEHGRTRSWSFSGRFGKRESDRAEVLRSAAEPGPERHARGTGRGRMVDASGEDIRPHGKRGGPCPRDLRRHRLAEVLLQSLFDLDTHRWKTAPASSTYPHEPVVESVCTFLGHPPLPARPPDPERDVLRPDRTEIRDARV